MIFYFINGVDRGCDIEPNSLQIKLGLNRRSNSASFQINDGSKPSGNQITKLYHGGIVDSVSSNDIILKESYETGYNLFRVGQKITIRINESDEYTDIISAYDEDTRTLTMTNTPPVSVVEGDYVGEIIFGGVISRVLDTNVFGLDKLIWQITCVGYEKLFDKKLVADTWENADARYIINDFLNTTVNYNSEIDSMSYADNTAIQAAWTEADDADNPTVNSDNLEGVNSADFGWTNSSGDASWSTSFTAQNVTNLVGTTTGLPVKGDLMIWIKSADLANVTDLSLIVSDGTEDFEISLDFDAAETDWQYLTVAMATGTVTGAIDWSAITNASVVVTQTGDGSILFNGFRINARNSFTAKNLQSTTELASYKSPTVRPTQVISTLAQSYEFVSYIDFEQDLHFKDKDIQECFYEINDTAEIFFDLQTELDESQLGNRIIIEGGDRTSDSIYSQAIKGDETVREWIMKSKFNNLSVYEDDGTTTDTMEAGTNTTTVNATAHGLTTGDWIVNRTRDVAREVTVVSPNQFTVNAVPSQTSGDTFSLFATEKTVGVEGFDDESLFEYMSNYNEKSIRAAQTTDTLDTNTYLLFTYNEVNQLSVPYVDSGSADALRALGLGDGVFDLDKVVDKNIVDIPTAITLAQAKVNEYSNPIITGTFSTDFHGFKIGDLLNVVETVRAIAGDYVIHKISMKQRGGRFKDHFNYTVEFGTTLFGAIEFFQKLLAQNDGLEINPDAIVETYVTANEDVEVADTNTIYKYGGNWKFEPSTGQPVPSRYNLASYS